jgi:plasmid stabilization system protein ParE
MKLRFTPRAANDLADIADYTRERDPKAALRVRGAILESLQNLVLFPQVGRLQSVAGIANSSRDVLRTSSITRRMKRRKKLLFFRFSIPRASASIPTPRY